MIVSFVAIVFFLLLADCCSSNTEIEWTAASLRPHYHEEFNLSSPYFEIRTLQPIRIDESNPNDFHSLCVFDSLDIEWTYRKEVRQDDSLGHAAIAFALPGQYEDILLTPIGSFFQSLRKNDEYLSISKGVEESNIEIVSSEMKSSAESSITSDTNIKSLQQQIAVTAQQMHSDGTIFCSSEDNIFCRPLTQGINLLQDIGVLIVNFDRDTNRPKLDSTEDILNALDIVPLPLHEVIAEWRSPRQLLLQLNESDVSRLVTAHQSGEPVRILLKTSRRQHVIGLSGKKTLRVSEVGKFHLFAVNSKTGEVLSNLWEITVGHCPDNGELLPSILMGGHHKQLKEDLKELTPIFSQNGVYAVTGQHSVVIGDSAFPVMVSTFTKVLLCILLFYGIAYVQTTGSWSISFWIRLLEIPTGAYRSLLYKGSSDNIQRTPSVWLLPDSNKFTVRVSTDENSDAGTLIFFN
jgi:hypothetical protein